MLVKVGSRFGVGPVRSDSDSSHPTPPSVQAITRAQWSKRLRMVLLYRAVNVRAARAPAASLSGLWTDTPEEVDDVPHVGGSHLAAMAFHLGIATHTVGDDGEDLAIAGSEFPLAVGQIRRAWILRRERAVTVPHRPVALPAGPVKRLATGGDRFRRGLNRILDRGRLRIAARGRLSED